MQPADFLRPSRFHTSRAQVLAWAIRRATFRVARRLSRACAAPLIRARIAFLTYKIDSTQQYLAECAVDGLDQSLSIGRFCAQMSADIAERSALRGRL